MNTTNEREVNKMLMANGFSVKIDWFDGGSKTFYVGDAQTAKARFIMLTVGLAGLANIMVMDGNTGEVLAEFDGYQMNYMAD